jgi:hypothetical protein
MERQRLDVEQIHQQQDRQQDQLGPLGVVPKEEPQILEDELSLGGGYRAEEPGNGSPHGPADPSLGALLCLGEPGMVEATV